VVNALMKPPTLVVVSIGISTVGDMFDRHELALPMMLYTASPFVGPEVGPL
jgi:hypothetical protein